jgi:hypothetical protein
MDFDHLALERNKEWRTFQDKDTSSGCAIVEW